MIFKCLNGSEELHLTYQYCCSCGAAVDEEEVLICYYFQRGIDYSVTLLFLEKYHAAEMSMCTLHNRLREYGLRRRNVNSCETDSEIYQAIQQELEGPGCMRGYPAMWHTLRLNYGIQAPRRKFEGYCVHVQSFLTFKGNVWPRIAAVTSGPTNRITPTLINAKGSSSFFFCPLLLEPLDRK